MNRIFSISLWLQVTSPHSSAQTVFATGSTSWNTGVSFRVKDSARFVLGRLIGYIRHLYTGNIAVYDTLTTWSHIVLVIDDAGLLYINYEKCLYITFRLYDVQFDGCEYLVVVL